MEGTTKDGKHKGNKPVELPKLRAGWWEPPAAALPSASFEQRVPLHVMFGESHDLVSFALKHWRAETDGAGRQTRPGLESAGKKFTLTTVAEIEDLAATGRRLQSAYLLALEGPTVTALKERGTFLVSETRAALEYLFDDGVEDDNDARLAAIVAAHKDDPETADAIAGALTDYVALANQHRAELDGVGGFEAKLLDEGAALAEKLLDHPQRALASEASQKALERRNRVLQLLQQRINLGRGAARFVFRAHPEIARLALSAYERRRRQVRREKKAETGAGETGGK